MKTDEFISNDFCEKYISANSYHPTIETTWSMRLLPHTTILPGYDVPSPKRLSGLFNTKQNYMPTMEYTFYMDMKLQRARRYQDD